jgi:hypothetical protein
MFKRFKRIWFGISKDCQHNYHKLGCLLYSHAFTVIKNTDGSKMYRIKYCPICGEKLDGN